MDSDGRALNTGVPLPIPPTVEAADLIADRSGAIMRRYGVPFLLENAAHYLPDLPSDPQIGDDIGLMNAICDRSGCWQLLDLHNVWCNAVNHRQDPFDAIDRMQLARVIEIHVAGGAWTDGFWTDAHNGRVPAPVWDLLRYTLPRTPNVCGVVFELLEDHAVRVGAELIADELVHARAIWRECRFDTPRDGSCR